MAYWGDSRVDDFNVKDRRTTAIRYMRRVNAMRQLT